MMPDRVSNPGPLTYELGALLIALCGPAFFFFFFFFFKSVLFHLKGKLRFFIHYYVLILIHRQLCGSISQNFVFVY